MSTFVQTLETRCLFSAGSLDLTYGAGTGVGTDKLPSGTLIVHDSALQSGDRMLIAGSFQPKGGAVENFLARYTADGSRDTGFLGSATVIGNPRGLSKIDLIATTPDDKILLLDREEGSGLREIVRLTASGKVDNTFGKNGIAKIPITDARTMIVGADGRIILTANDGNDALQVARLLGDGTLDPKFGTSGIVTSQFNLFGTNSENATYVRSALFAAENPDGTVVIAGSFDLNETNPVSHLAHPYVARLTSRGKLDTTFGGDGTVEIQDQGSVMIEGFAALADGKVVLSFNGTASSALMRFNTDGSTDTTFGDSGVASVGGASSGIIAQADGRVVVSTPSQLFRYDAAGVLDSSFADNNVPNDNQLVGIGSDGSILTYTISHKQATDVFGYTIRPARRWSEQAPAGLLSAGDISVAPTGPYRFAIQWRAELNVAVKSLALNSIRIIGPNGATYKATFLGTTKTGNGSQRTANYKFAAPGGSWDNADDGVYTIRLLGGFVKDTQGNPASAMTLGRFTVQIA